MLPTREHGFIEGFDWGLYPEAEKRLNREIASFLKNHSLARSLSKRMTDASTRFFDWIDHLVLPDARVNGMEKLGFRAFDENGFTVFRHTRTIFFPVVLSHSGASEIVLKPEHLDDFVKKVRKTAEINGERFAPYRKAEIKKEGRFLFSAAERRGYSGFVVEKSHDIDEYKKAFSTFAKRNRLFPTDRQGMNETERLVDSILKDLPPSRAADAFFRNERAYWESRNKAGQMQRKRQDELGLGWGNHDHHTYRSSRQNFSSLIRIFEKFGYLCRERFYAGPAAGWGAQILEHQDCDIVLFADVDITPGEKDRDFAHEELDATKELGTVGLWVGLHGESILQAGLHHLEARFDFERLMKDLPNHGKEMMSPFSYFAFLKQAFSKGELWKVEKKRLDALLKAGSITGEQYEKFSAGALGSHMENLQRTQGYKGFNQDSVTAIIKATDPRKQVADKYAHA